MVDIQIARFMYIFIYVLTQNCSSKIGGNTLLSGAFNQTKKLVTVIVEKSRKITLTKKKIVRCANIEVQFRGNLKSTENSQNIVYYLE